MTTTATPTLRDWLREGPFALAMSSGFFGFFAHCGVLTVLEDEGLLPTRLSGSSAGALVTGAWASGLDAVRLRDELMVLERAHFWDPRPGLGLLAGRLFRDKLDALLPTRDFTRCRAPVAISIYELLRLRTRVAESGDLSAAIHASCALPGLFHPVWIDGAPFIDGGVADLPGLAGIPVGARVLHHGLGRGRARPRPGLAALRIDGLPRVGPFRLHQGARAFDHARRATQQALARAAAVI